MNLAVRFDWLAIFFYKIWKILNFFVKKWDFKKNNGRFPGRNTFKEGDNGPSKKKNPEVRFWLEILAGSKINIL